MTTNALTTLTSGGVALTEMEELILAESLQDENAYDLQPAKVKIAPGGIGKFLIGDETTKSFTAIVAVSQKIRGYWPGSGTGKPPLCSSNDGVRGYMPIEVDDGQVQEALMARRPHEGVILLDQKDAPWPDYFDCASCPMAQWGSEHQRRGGQGRGQACKAMRRLLLLIDGWALPALMSLPPTSIKKWDEYCSAHAARRSAYWAVRTRFELDSAESTGGETYNLIRVAMAEPLEDEYLRSVVSIRREYADLVRGMAVDAAEYDTTPTVANGNGAEEPATVVDEEDISF